MKQRGKNLSDHDVAGIVGILDSWVEKLTWPGLCEAIARRTREHYTRQALFAHAPIREAFARRKAALAQSRSDGRPRSEAVDADPISQLRAENDRLKEDIFRLKQQVNGLQDQFSVWAYNAYAKGLSERDLSRPLPDVDRDRTDDMRKRRTAK